MAGGVHRKAGKITGLIFVSKELLEFLSGFESVQFMYSISVGAITDTGRFAELLR